MHIHIVLQNLAKEFFDPHVDIDRVELIYENSYATEDGADEQKQPNPSGEADDSDDEPLGGGSSAKKNKLETIYSLSMVQNAIKDFKCVDMLQEISQELRDARSKGGFYNNSNDNWEFLSEHISVEQYLCFTFAMIGLAEYDALSVINRKLAFTTARTYFLLLTTPGAKRCKVFEERVILKCFHLFNFLQQIKHPNYAQQLKSSEKTEIQMNFISILDDFHTIFKIVSLEDYVSVKEELIKTLKNVILFNHINGYDNTYSYNLSMKSYEIFEIICLPIHGEVVATMYMILCNSSVLYKYNHGPARHGQIQVPEKVAHGDTITDFFIYLLDKFPTDTSNVLTRFIQSLISNADDNMKPEDYSRLIDIGVKYEAAMFTKCNLSLIPWLDEACLSSDVTQRANATEFLGRMLLIDSKVEWVLFQVEISDIPREIHILKILLTKIVDVHNTLKQKAIGSIIKAFSAGNKNTIKILDASFNLNAKLTKRGKSASPLKRNPTSTAEDVPRGIDLLQEEVHSLPRKLFHLLQNNNLAHIRRSSVVLLEMLAERNRDLINDSIFVDIISEVPEDPTPLVRKQLIPFFNKMLKVYPNHRALIELWVKCVLILLNDADAKIVEISMDSLKINIFDNIVRYEESSSERNYMPWIILRSILKFGNRNVLRNAVESWINNKFLTFKTLAVIESHIYTANCTEAWVLLSLIANKMQSRNPDMIVRAFSDLMQYDMYNSSLNLHLILEVIKAWLKDFSRSALNHIFNMLNDLLLTGSSNSSLVTYIYDVCASVKKMVDSDTQWIEKIYTTSRDFILKNREDFLYNHCDERFYNYLLIFSDSNADLPQQPDERVLNFLVEYLVKASEQDSEVSQITDVDRKICIVVVTTTRLAIRDTDIAAKVIPEFAKLLKMSIRENIVTNCIICLSDLCKKHTSLVEPTMQEVVNKLKSNNDKIRHTALKNLRELLMQDYIKMRGRVLLNVLTAIVDSCDDIANESASIILGYVEEKNKHLLNTCFLESVFVYNGYLQYDGFELFPVSEIDNEPSVLQGPRKIDKRFTLYKFFIENIDEVNLLLLLKHVNLIYDKLKKGTFIKCDEGIYTLKDLLYIFKLICDSKSRKKDKPEGDSDVPDSPAKPAVGARGAPTIATAMAMVEKVVQTIPKLDAAVRNYDPSIGIFQDRFNEAVVTNFRHLVEFAQPQAFWQNIRDKLKDVDKDRKTKRRIHRKAMSNAGSVSEMGESDDGASTVTDYESIYGDDAT